MLEYDLFATNRFIFFENKAVCCKARQVYFYGACHTQRQFNVLEEDKGKEQ